MTDEQRERSYEYYKQWQRNKSRYRSECLAYTLIFCVGLFFILTNLKKILLGIGALLVVGALWFLIKTFQKWYKMNKSLMKIESVIKKFGAENIEIDTKNNSISFIMPFGIKNEQLSDIENVAVKEGLKMKLRREKSDKGTTQSTNVGYINKNHQKNNGRTNKNGSDNNQYFYEMECLRCGHIYYANGTDIWQRKCPKCQGGKP